MIRTIALAAAAATVLAAPSFAADFAVRVPTAGKSATQLHADIRQAARKVCIRATTSATFPQQEMERCVKQTVAATIAQANDPALAAAANLKLAQR